MNIPMIQDGVDAYFQSIRNTAMLAKDEEFTLAIRVVECNDRDAAAKIIIAHLPLAAKIARGYKKYGLPIGDLISEANVGLVKAMNKFDPMKGFRFSTYATLWVKAEIQEYVIRSWSLVKIGSTSAQQKLFYGLEKTKKRLGITNITANNMPDLVTAFNIPSDTIYEMDTRLRGDSSLNVQLNEKDGSDGNLERQDLLVDDRDHVDEIIKTDERSWQIALVKKAVDTLLPRDRLVFQRRHLTDEPATLKDLAAELCISRERVRQLETRALSKIKEYVATHG